MFKTYFKSAYRNLVKYKSFTLINLIGLSLGLSSIMVLAFMLYQFITVNGQFENKERMAYIRATDADGKQFKQTPYPFLDEVLKTCPEVEAGTHIQSWSWPWLKFGDKEFQDNTWYVDTGFFKVFTYPLEYGNPATAMHDKWSVVISHEMAKKLFGNDNAIGKIITADDSVELVVTGVLKQIPTNTTLRPDVLMTTALLNDNIEFKQNANWHNSMAENYLLLKPNANVDKLNKQLNNLAQTFYHPDVKKIRLELNHYKDFVKNEAGDIVSVIIKGIIGCIFFILIILIANLINLNAATMLGRAKEVAVKKMMGSSRRKIVLQFCIENAMVVFAALILAFLLFNSFLLPYVNTIVANKFGTILPNINHDYPLALWFVMSGIIVVVIAGSYPAFYLTSLKVTDVIKGKITRTSKNQYSKNIFITLQFIVAITFIGISVILGKQLKQMKTAALGFDKENVLVIPLDLAFKNKASALAQFDELLNKLYANPYIKNISTSNTIPTAYRNNFNTYFDATTNKEINMRHAVADAGLLPTYNIPIIEGRNFKNVDKNNEVNNVIINKTAMKAYGWSHAVGKQLKASGNNKMLTVIGVMDDFHYLDLTRNIEPLLHYYGDKQQLNYAYLSIRIDPKHINEIVSELQDGFKSIPSRRPFNYQVLNDRIDIQYGLLNGILKVTSYVSGLTIFIAAMGLFGLVALFSKQRVKEIGIRKVLGASFIDIAKMLSQNYALLIIIASAVATPLVLLIMGRWLGSFAYRTNISWWVPLIAGLAALFIALSIVIFQSLKALVANPVKNLRTE